MMPPRFPRDSLLLTSLWAHHPALVLFTKQVRFAHSNVAIHTISLHVGCPEGKVVTQQLHDESRVFVTIFTEGVKFGDGVVESSFSQATGPFGGVQYFVIEDGEI